MRREIPATALALLLACFSVPAPAQRAQDTGTITLYVRSEFGERLTIPPQVRVTPMSSGMPMAYAPIFTGDGGIVFSHLVPGEDYEIVIKADGYQITTETISLPLGSDPSVTDIVYLKPLSEKGLFASGKGQYVLAPKAQKEVQRGLEDLRSRNFNSARKHLEKALRMAPGNPYVNYVMGMIYLTENQAGQAKSYLETSVSIDPKQPPSLYALGSARFQLNDYAGAVQALESAVQLDATSYKAEWLLAYAYLKQKNYEKARDYAAAALKNGKQDAAPAQLLLAEALANLGEREKAANTFEDYLRLHPKDPNAAKIRGYVQTLRQLPAPAVVPVVADSAATVGTVASQVETPQPVEPSIAALTPPAVLPPGKDWAPPDVDAAKPLLISGPTCSLPKVLQAAAKNAVQFVTSLQEFSATEEYQSVEIKRNEQLEKPVSSEYDYVVLIEEMRPGLYHVGELREGRPGTIETQGMLRDVGAAARALAFHPSYRDDFNWTCEGLGDWKGKPTWVVHFDQKKDHPTSMLAGFQTPSQLYAIPLKGRAWVSERDGNILHLETDLVRPMTELGLKRQHFAIDYAPVSFQTHKVQLWLPESVDVYYEYRGHYMHSYHHYSNFKLFWVGTSEKMGKPKGSEEQP